MRKILAYLAFLIILFSACKDDTNSVAEKNYDLTYGTDSLQTMDVFLPENTETSIPFVIWIHGGSWTSGDKSEESYIQEELFANGIPSANVNYRLTAENKPDITYKEIFADIDKAIAYVAKNRKRWNLTNSKIILAGASAGAHLAMHRAYQSKENIVGIVSLVGPTFLDYKPLLQYYSLSDFAKNTITRFIGADYNIAKDSIPQAYFDASPIHFINPDIPIRMFHGDTDLIVPLYQPLAMQDSLLAKGAEHELTIIKRVGHDLGTEENRAEILSEAISFIKSK